MPKHATQFGPVPFAEEYVPNPRRDQHAASLAALYQRRRQADAPCPYWGYLGLFYHNSTVRGVTRADA